MEQHVLGTRKSFWIAAARLIGLAAFCLALNIALSRVNDYFGWPMYMDSVGTILTSMVGGALPAIAGGLLTNLVRTFAFNDSASIYYGTLNVMIAVIVAGFCRHGLKKRSVIPMILCLTLAGGGLGSLLTWFLFGFGGEGASAAIAEKIQIHLRQGHHQEECMDWDERNHLPGRYDWRVCCCGGRCRRD